MYYYTNDTWLLNQTTSARALSEYGCTVVVQPNKNSTAVVQSLQCRSPNSETDPSINRTAVPPSSPRPMSLAKFPATCGETNWSLAARNPMKTKITGARQITLHSMNHLCPSSPDHWQHTTSQIQAIAKESDQHNLPKRFYPRYGGEPTKRPS